MLFVEGSSAWGAVLPVTLHGPKRATRSSGPHAIVVMERMEGVVHRWNIAPGTGELLSQTNGYATFRTGNSGVTVLTCQVENPVTGDSGVGTFEVQLVAPGGEPEASLRHPGVVGKNQGPLLAWVEQPVAGLSYRWEVEGGQNLGPSDQTHFVFRSGDGPEVTLRCRAERDGHRLWGMVGRIFVPEQAPAKAPDFFLEVPVKAARGQAGLEARVAGPDDGHAYEWTIEGGVLHETQGTRVRVTPGQGERMRIRCIARHLATESFGVAEEECELVAPLPDPEVVFPDRVYPGQTRLARVTNLPSEITVSCDWTVDGAEVLAGEPDASPAECSFRATAAGPATARCMFRDMATGQETVWIRPFTVQADRPLAAPARILAFQSEPAGPQGDATPPAVLTWALDRDPTSQNLVEVFSGRTWRLAPTDRFFPLPGTPQGRTRYRLTTAVRDGVRDEDAVDSRHLDIAVPGISVLAGKPGPSGPCYLRNAGPGVPAWGKLSGLAWKAPWLYFAQADQHTIRRTRLTGGEVEEVAGMRGIPGQGAAGVDLLFEPGQLVHRRFTGVDGQPVEDWLVLQPGVHCIQRFQEGATATSMGVFAGLFGRTAAATAGRTGHLKAPSAMAVHGPTGHVFVADRGYRAIKLFPPEGGQEARILVPAVEAGGIAVNARGDVFYSDTDRHVIHVLRNLGPSLTLDSQFGPPEVFAGALDRAGAVDGRRKGEGRLRRPLGLAIDASTEEVLLVADAGNNLVRKVPADPASEGALETAGGNPYLLPASRDHIALHASGITARVDESSPEIRLFSEGGQTVRPVAGSRGLGARGIALDAAGNLFYSDPALHVVWVQRLLNPPLGMDAVYGAPEAFAGQAGAPGFAGGERTTQARLRSPEALTQDPRDLGHLQITDSANQVVWRVPMDLATTGKMTSIGRPRTVEGPVTNEGLVDGTRLEARLSSPAQVCGNGLGQIFVLDQMGLGQASALREIDPLGTVRTLGTSPMSTAEATGTTGFAVPTGVAADAAGNLYVGDAQDRRIRRIAQDGTVTVVAGNGLDPTGGGADEGPVKTGASFFPVGFLGIEPRGQLLALETEGARRLRKVDCLNAMAGNTTLVADHVAGDLIALFPASPAPGWNTLYIHGEPGEPGGRHRLTVKRTPSLVEVVDPQVGIQALCADRMNRIWVVDPGGAEVPGCLRLHRYTWVEEKRNPSAWAKVSADLQLAPPGFNRLVDGRPYAACAPPMITAMAADSHGNVLLADSANGAVWKVREDLGEVSLAAGGYPSLGPPGPGLSGPLQAMRGLALTPDDDIVVTSGAAIFRIVQRNAAPARRWAEARTDVHRAPANHKPKVDTPARPMGLRDPKKERVWTIELNRCRLARHAAQETLRIALTEHRAAVIAAETEPHSRILRDKASGKAWSLERAELQLAWAVAEANVCQATYDALLENDWGTPAGSSLVPTGKDSKEELP